MEPVLSVLILAVVRLGIPIAVLTLVSLFYSRAAAAHALETEALSCQRKMSRSLLSSAC
jgi:hypothetical protein